MKNDIFNQYVERIIELFEITREELFSKTKKREAVDARYLLYYLCHKRPMTLSYIQRFMKANGYEIQHSSVIHGIKTTAKRVKSDSDYSQVVKQMEKAVFI
jgi:chromosomal replication initiation ATPase DnaA